MTALTFKVQTWGDDLRIPCLTEPSETSSLLTELEPLLRMSIPFQSKHLPALKRDTWFVLRRPADKSRSGLLVLWPARQACVYISGEPVSQKRPSPRVALLRLRVDPQFLAAGTGLTVFAATLSGVSRTLTIEDTLVWKGRAAATDPFRKRWSMAAQWIDHYCILDPRLLAGLQIEMAPWGPLASIKPEGVWELQSDQLDQRRFLWIHHESAEPLVASPLPLIETTTPAHAAPTLEVVGPLIAIATREAGPEQWALASADGLPLGRALIRTLTVSDQLRSNKNTVRVEVTWNSTFQKWEVKGLTEGAAVHSTKFAASK